MPFQFWDVFLANQIWSRFGSTKNEMWIHLCWLKRISQDLTPNQMVLSAHSGLLANEGTTSRVQSSWWDHGWRNFTPVGIYMKQSWEIIYVNPYHLDIYGIFALPLVVFNGKCRAKIPLDGMGWLISSNLFINTYRVDWFWGAHTSEILPWKLTCPLKINGWKMYSLLK